MNLRHLRLCLVTNLQNKPFHFYKPFLIKAIQGGITSIQLREKKHSTVDLKSLALDFKKALKPFNIPLIINDRVDIAKEVDAEGVHLGQADLSPQEARKILGDKKIIGLSIESLDELKKANQLNCIDYVAASAVFRSKTKPDCKMIWGIKGLKEITHLSQLPVLAIGGVTINNIHSIMETGAFGVAVIGAIHDHINPLKASADLIGAIDQYNKMDQTLCLKK